MKRRDYRKGGPVRGPGGPRADKVPARLSNGEYVLPADTVQQVGLPALEQLRMATHRFADGGMFNSFGNDMTDANRMNAAADAMKKDRMGPEPDQQQQMMMFLSGLFGKNGMNGMNGMNSSSLPTDNRTLGDMGGSSYSPVSNLSSLGGNFAHGGAVSMAAGGFVTPSQLLAQMGGAPTPGFTPPNMGPPTPPGYSPNYDWKGLQNYRANQAPIGGQPPAAPRVAPPPAAGAGAGLAGTLGSGLARLAGGVGMALYPTALGADDTNPADQNAFFTERKKQAADFQVPPSTRRTSQPNPLGFLNAPPANPGAVTASAQPIQPVNAGVPTGNMDRQVSPDRWTAPEGRAAIVRGDALAQRSPTMNAQDYQQANGGTLIGNMAGRQDASQRVVAGDSRQIGEQKTVGGAPFEPSIGQPRLPMPGVGERRLMGPGPQNTVSSASSLPTYQTDYTVFGQNGQQGTASFVGPNRRVGGGTVSAPDQGNGGTTEGNVAALNRQIAAMRSLREAQNPGITTGTGSFAPGQGLPTFDPFSRPTDGNGDSEKRRQEYESLMREAATGRGLTRTQREAMMHAAQGLVAPGLAQMQQQGQMYGHQMDANQRQQAALWAAQNQAAQQANEQQKQDFEQQKWGQQYGLNAANAASTAQQRGAQTQEAQMRAQGLAKTQQLLQMYRAMSEKNPNDPRLGQVREWIMLSQRRNEPADPNAWAQTDTAAVPAQP